MRDTFSSYLSPSVRVEQDDESRTNKNRRLEAESPSACGQHHGQFLNDGIDPRILRIIENHQQQLLVRVARQIGARAHAYLTNQELDELKLHMRKEIQRVGAMKLFIEST